jgi:retinol dehydrogenase-12
MSRFSLLRFLRSQYTTLPPVEHVDLSGKTVMVVGANTGLGFEASKHFARMNPAHLVLACRSKSKGEAAILGMY